jgi:Big-like domain-containing protein
MRRLQTISIAMLVLAALVGGAEGQTRGGFDGNGHLLMHGVPRFVLGVYDSGGTYSTDPAFWEDAIFSPSGPRGLQGFPLNVYLNYWLGAMPIGATNALLDVLHGHGQMYLQTGNCFADGSWLRYGPTGFSIASQTYVQQFAQHPAALGYYIMDECDDALIPETQQHYQQLKAWDPQGIALATALAAAYRDPGLWTSATDVLAIDPYILYGAEPAQGYPHFVVADFAAKARAVASPTRPIWTVLQFFKFTSNSRMPTEAELRAHAVMSIVEGAQGLFWWDIGVNGLRQLDAATVSASMAQLKSLTTELAGLEPALLAAPADGALVGNTTRFSDPIAGRIAQLQHNIAVEILYSRVVADQAEIAALKAGDTSKSPLLAGAANVRTRTKIVNGVGYVFAYNYTNLPQPVTFTWQSALSSVKESKSGQTFPVSGASWSDSFGPYEARVYIVKAGGSSLAVSFANPPRGATVSGTTPVTMTATGGSGGGYRFTLTVDGTTIYSGTNATFNWNTATVAAGAHTLTATVVDSASSAATTGQAVLVAPAASFVDVSTGHPFFSWIEALFATGITSGCAASPPEYCPDAPVARGPMAVFLLRGMHGAAYQPPAPTGVVFADVPVSQPFAGWIEQLAREAITGGCATSPPRYCPDAGVRRGEMAVFLVRAKYGAAYQPPAATGMFADVPTSHPFARWIEQLARDGVTGGCATSPLRYCPDDPVTRGQMAVFLVRAFQLSL